MAFTERILKENLMYQSESQYQNGIIIFKILENGVRCLKNSQLKAEDFRETLDKAKKEILFT